MSEIVPRICHVDVDQAYVSAARIAWPDRLAGVEQLLVGGHPERRGTVASASYACRKRGVHAGMPMVSALRLCPDAVACPVPWATVKRKTREVFRVLRRFAEVVERASIDEGYLLLPPYDEAPEALAARIREAVIAETAMPVSLGVSSLRFAAKMATNRAKPSKGGSGVYVVPPGSEHDFVGEHPLGAIPGVGPAFVASLERRGVSSTASARLVDLATLTLWLGPARARFLYDRVRAIDPTPVEADRGERKSISSENTFTHDLLTTSALEAELAPLVADVGQTLRGARLYARTVTVKLRSADFTDRSRGRTLPQFVRSDEGILRVATALLRELRRERGGPVRLLGVTLSHLEGAGAVEQMTIREIVPPVETDEERGLRGSRSGTETAS